MKMTPCAVILFLLIIYIMDRSKSLCMGQIMRTEVVTFSGRIDALCETKDYVYLFEFKLDGSVEDALKQIEDKDYAVGYEASGKNVVKIGVAFDTEKRNIADWKMI